MKELKKKIDAIYDAKYHPNCHPSREADKKNEEAIKLIAEAFDELEFEVSVVHEWKLQKEGI
jgi:sugar-specific transcriptional regulator TrmB